MTPNSMIRTDSATDTHDDGTSGPGIKASLDLKVLGLCTRAGITDIGCSLVHYRQDSLEAPLHLEPIAFEEIPVPHTTRTPILNLLHESPARPSAISRINVLVGRMFSAAVMCFCKNRDIDTASIDLIGAHSRTVERLYSLASRELHHSQLGWSTVLTVESGITTIADFRITEKGEPSMSTPAAFVGGLLLRHPTKFRVCLDIDDITTLSFFPPCSGGSAAPPISRDCGPGNMLINYAMRYSTCNDIQHDNDGRFAAQGSINHGVVDSFLSAHDFIHTPPAMHMTTEMFGDHEGQRLIDECLYRCMPDQDTLATITRISAQNIVRQYHRLLAAHFSPEQKVDEMFICGPGVRNSNIIDHLKTELPKSMIMRPLNDIGIPCDANEAVCHAHLALESVLRQALEGYTPSTPNSRSSQFPPIAGKIVRGKRWDETVRQMVSFAGGRKTPARRDIIVTESLEDSMSKLNMR